MRTAFGLVCAASLVATLVAIGQTQRLDSTARDIVDNILTSVRLVGQLESEIERRKILVDDELLVDQPRERAVMREQLTAVDRQIAVTMRQYEPLISLPDERATWEHTRADLARLDAPFARAVAFANAHHGEDASDIMNDVRVAFALVEQDLDRLIELNDRGATLSLGRFEMTRFWLVVTLLTIGLATIALTLLVAWWACRQVTFREDQMARDTRRLEARNRELDAFAARVAHDLRGTLTTVNLAMAPLAAKVPQDDRALEILRRGTRKMEALVEDLLVLARVEKLAQGRCDPAAVVALVAQDLAPSVEAARGALRVSVANAEVTCSEGLLRQAVTNLVENAVKYHRPEIAPDVEISGARVDGGYDLRVSDNGVGMSRDEANHAGEPFYRSPRVRDQPGTGLGLSIVNRVAEASGGRLIVTSRLGQGSTFVVHLPLAGAPEGGGAGAGA